MFNDIKDLSKLSLELRTHLMAAQKFNNQSEINKYSYQLIYNNARIVDQVIDILERVEKSYTNNVISSPIPSDVDITEYTPMNFDSPNGNGNE